MGAFATAATGTAISTLSGAAAGEATAAWIGRTATFGLAGATAGRLALGPIALVSLPVQAAIGAKLAGNRERNAIRRYKKAAEDMTRREQRMAEFKQPLLDQARRAELLATNLSRRTGQLETADPGTDEARDAAGKLDTDMRLAVEPLRRFAETAAAVQEDLGEEENE